MEKNSSRAAIIRELQLLSLPSRQQEYQASLIAGAGHAPTELIESFCTDLFSPKAPEFLSDFSEEEVKALAHLYGLIIEAGKNHYVTVEDMLRDSAWRKVISLAKELYVDFHRRP